MANFGEAMGNSQLRFFAVEHVFGMLIGTALAHVGRKKVKNAVIERRGRLALIFYGLALLAILVPELNPAAGRLREACSCRTSATRRVRWPGRRWSR
jgi:hypothetical protein